MTDTLIKISDGAGGFTTVAGLRSRKLSMNAETVDLKDEESRERWTAIFRSAGIRNTSISGRATFADASADMLMRQNFFDGSVRLYQIVIPKFLTLQGQFQVTGLEFDGEHNGKVTYTLVLESAGTVEIV